MANIKISELPAASSISGTDEFELNQSGTSRKITAAILFAAPPAIGSTTPAAGAFTTLSASGASTLPTLYGSSAANGDITIEGTSDVTKTTSYVILQPTGGKVGIGTADPSAKLTVGVGNTTASADVLVINTANANVNGLAISNWTGSPGTYGPRILFDSSSVGAWYIGISDGGSNFDIARTWGTPDFRIDANGKVGIGTTAPDKALEINSATGANLRLTYNDANGTAANYADFSMSSGGNLTIAPSGGNTNVTGAFTLSGALTLTATASPTGAGTGAVGQIAWDTAYIYVCTATNDWRRAALTDF